MLAPCGLNFYFYIVFVGPCVKKPKPKMWQKKIEKLLIMKMRLRIKKIPSKLYPFMIDVCWSIEIHHAHC
jgi:hypothetical protein